MFKPRTSGILIPCSRMPFSYKLTKNMKSFVAHVLSRIFCNCNALLKKASVEATCLVTLQKARCSIYACTFLSNECFKNNFITVF